MAFNPENLGVIAYCNGFTIWHYRSADDNNATIKAVGYFDQAAPQLTLGDIVVFQDSVNVSGMRRVATIAGSTVTTAALG